MAPDFSIMIQRGIWYVHNKSLAVSRGNSLFALAPGYVSISLKGSLRLFDERSLTYCALIGRSGVLTVSGRSLRNATEAVA